MIIADNFKTIALLEIKKKILTETIFGLEKTRDYCDYFYNDKKKINTLKFLDNIENDIVKNLSQTVQLIEETKQNILSASIK